MLKEVRVEFCRCASIFIVKRQQQQSATTIMAMIVVTVAFSKIPFSRCCCCLHSYRIKIPFRWNRQLSSRQMYRVAETSSECGRRKKRMLIVIRQISEHSYFSKSVKRILSSPEDFLNLKAPFLEIDVTDGFFS